MEDDIASTKVALPVLAGVPKRPNTCCRSPQRSVFVLEKGRLTAMTVEEYLRTK